MPLSENSESKLKKSVAKEDIFCLKTFLFKFFFKSFLLLHYLTQIFKTTFTEKQNCQEKLRSSKGKKKVFTLNLFFLNL